MILISIGANLPGPGGRVPLETARWAAAELDMLPGVCLRALSRWYLTEPVPPSGQPPYINGIARLAAESGSPEPDPAALLARLQAIEACAARVRSELNAARTLDLDIIAMGCTGETARYRPDPILPHPRAHLRAFVLEPLLEVAPGWVHPLLLRPAHDLLKDLGPQGVCVVSPSALSTAACSGNR